MDRVPCMQISAVKAQFIPFRSRNLLIIFSTSFPLKIALLWTLSCIVNLSVSHQKWELCMQLCLIRSVWMTYFKLQSFISKGREGKRKQVREGGGKRWKEIGLSKEKQSWHLYITENTDWLVVFCLVQHNYTENTPEQFISDGMICISRSA